MFLLNAFCTTCVESVKQQQNNNNSYHYHQTILKAAMLTSQNLLQTGLKATQAWRRARGNIMLSLSSNCLGKSCKRVKIRAAL